MVIPKGEYGAGGVIVWDPGADTNETKHVMTEGIENGHLSFSLRGEKLRGGYVLTRIREGDDETWSLVKSTDEDADARGGRGTRLADARVGGRMSLWCPHCQS
jgi:DNA ligase D-like protein (predicted 3'-phosphoesterase)